MNEREPLLSDEAITDRAKSSYNFDLAWAAIDYGRTFYERMIDEGKLRVVEEVEYDHVKYPDGLSYPVCLGCKSIGRLVMISNYPYCPGCGNKIKR